MRSKSMFDHALVEAIETMASAVVRERIVSLALAWGHLPEIPERGPELDQFVSGPLKKALAHALGPQAAASVLDELAPIVEHLKTEEVSRVRPSWPDLSAAPSRNTQPAPDDLPVVLIATSDPRSADLLSQELCGLAVAESIADAVTLLENVPRATLTIIDCKHPTVSAETLVTLAPELPEESRLLIWRETPALEREIASLTGGVPDAFVFCGTGASAEDVVMICRLLLE
jgi:hypothetical protein